MNILITVDYQGSFASPTGELYVPGAETIANKIQSNIDNPKYDMRIVTFDTHDKQEYIGSEENTAYGFPIHCEFGTKGWELFNIKMPTQEQFNKSIKDMFNRENVIFNMFQSEQDVYFTKNKFDIWEVNNSFEKWVSKNLDSERDVIYVQGVATNYCVFMNVSGFIKRGFKVIILEDAVKAIPDDSEATTMAKMIESGVEFNSAESFEEFVIRSSIKMTPSIKKAEQVINNIRDKVQTYVKENNIKSLVIGISGGLDSSVVAALCQEKYTGVPLIGISIPMSSSSEHKEQARWVGENFCTVFDEFHGWDEEWTLDGAYTQGYQDSTNMINDIFTTLVQTDKLAKKAGFDPESFPTSVLKGNVKARMRMITLYDLARKTNGMVLSTDNYSEFMMGFWTLCGDVGDYGPIQNIGKGFELPIIAEVLNIRDDIIYQEPSDGLMVTEDNTDEAQLGANYKEVDVIMDMYIKQSPDLEIFIDNEKVQRIINRYKNMSYKRTGTVNLTREDVGID